MDNPSKNHQNRPNSIMGAKSMLNGQLRVKTIKTALFWIKSDLHLNFIDCYLWFKIEVLVKV